MCAFARENAAREIIVGTETGILHRLRKENPGKAFYPVSERMVCPNMKKTTLDNLAECLREMKTVVTVPEPIATRARRSKGAACFESPARELGRTACSESESSSRTRP